MSKHLFPQGDLEVPKLIQHNLPNGRVYQVADGEHKGNIYPSITRVLGAKEKPHLQTWKDRVGEDEAERIRNTAALRGTKLHSLAECYLRNQDLPPVEPFEGVLWQYLKPWLTEHITGVYGNEVDLYSPRLTVAGRTDCVALVDGEIAIVDFKQANKPKKKEWITDYFLQGTFYALSVYELTGVPVKRMVFPITSPQGLEVFESTPSKHYHELLDRIAHFYRTYAAEESVPVSA